MPAAEVVELIKASEVEDWRAFVARVLKSHDVSAAELARAMGVNRSTLSRWLKGKGAMSERNIREALRLCGHGLPDAGDGYRIGEAIKLIAAERG